ncbi:MAG TPA: D-alanyl-D-alanine carboxypeptidase/D-alanyl-D-alanine-endopeptidase [Myxococcaceae bacterium]|nr:D-alanyl-D-alanine carboxypeptidase/D-alanyl-D-alanine-endopeptidase [Myxococcaceae bacterium]
MVPAAIAAAVLCASTAFAGGKDAERAALKKALLEVLDRPSLKTARVSFELDSLDTGEKLLQQNADELLNPASNVKLVTAAASLWKLGPEYRFETEFLTDNEYRDGRAKVLYVRGKGDPSITNERLYGMVTEIFHAGLHEVGDVVVDDSWFDGERLAPGFDQDKSDRSYNAPTGAVSINWNSVGVYVRAGTGPGQKGVVEIEPASDFFVVENGLTTGSRKYRRFNIVSEPAPDNKQRIKVMGAIPPDQSAVATYKKIDNPTFYFGHTLKQMLLMRGIKVHGRVRAGLTPDGAKVLSVAQSETFDLILKRMNKHSSNFVAEMLIKTLGAEVGGKPGTFAKGIEVVEDFLEKEVGIPRGTYVMKNGSGINDTNRFSSAQFTKILRYMFTNEAYAPEYVSALGIAGKDGTLKYRMEGSDAVGRLRAKTGTLFNVTALSGYVQAVGGERFIFSVLVNDFPGRLGPVVDSVDALGEAVAAYGTAGGPQRAVASVAAQQPVLASADEAKTKIKTYLALGRQKDKRNISFLRTVWRSEKDPAVRAVVAESIYRSDPEDYLGARTLLDSVSGTPEVYGRLRSLARDMNIDVPAVPAVVEVAAQGNAEALAKLLELVRPSSGDAGAEKEVSTALSEVGRTAPDELILALKNAPAADRDAAVAMLAQGLVRAADADHPFWPALRKSMGAVDVATATFAKQVDAALSLKIAEEKAPKPAAVAGQVVPASATTGGPGHEATAETRPGG